MRVKNCGVCLITLLIAQFMYCMDDQKIEIVIQVEPPSAQAPAPESTEQVDSPARQAPESTEQVDSPAPQTPPNATELAKKAVHAALGEDNDYLERLLTRRLEGKTTTPKIIPIHRIPQTSGRERLKAHLAAKTEKAQKDSLDLLSGQQGESSSSQAHSQTMSKWVLNAVLDEKLKDREVRENSDYWKYINGILVIVLPVITNLVQYYMTHHNCSSGSN